MYQVRTNADPRKPSDRGILVAEYPTYREAFRHWQRLSAAGDTTAFMWYRPRGKAES